MKNTAFFITAILALALCGCPDNDFTPDATLKVINNSNEYLVVYYDNSIPSDTMLSMNEYYPTSGQIDDNTILSNDSLEFRDAFIKTFEEREGSVLMLYLFSRDTLEQVSWDRIRDEYLILRRYDLTLEDLEAMDWTIEYP